MLFDKCRVGGREDVARRSAGVLAVAAGGLASAISWSAQTHVFAATRKKAAHPAVFEIVKPTR